MRTLQAQGLTLVPQTSAHAQQMFAVLCDPAIYAFENEPPPSLTWLQDRFARLESRQSPDGKEQWLNWVLRMPSGELIGYVQATVRPDASADIAYVLASAYWGQGWASRAVRAMVEELGVHYGVGVLYAVLKRANLRSLRLLERAGFQMAATQQLGARAVEQDELLMCRSLPPRG